SNKKGIYGFEDNYDDDFDSTLRSKLQKKVGEEEEEDGDDEENDEEDEETKVDKKPIPKKPVMQRLSLKLTKPLLSNYQTLQQQKPAKTVKESDYESEGSDFNDD